MRILMVHGRAQGGKDPVELKKIWVKTLKQGFAGHGRELPGDVSIDFPYYGDLLDDFVAKAKLPTPESVVQKGPGQNREFEQFTQSVLNEIKNSPNSNITNAEVESEMGPAGPQEKGVQNWRWVQAIVNVIDRRLTPVSGFTIEKFLTDVFLYVKRDVVTKAINKTVEDMLTDEPTVVVGHSLGTVVAYSVLRENRDAVDLRKFITMGSPLGIRAISAQLGVVENPARAVGWYNAYDERDIVALNPLDSTYFPTDPSIMNNNGVNNDTDNRHGIIGYLNDGGVAATLLSALR